MIRRSDDENDFEPGFDPGSLGPENDDDALEHEGAASVDDTYRAVCPYCMEENELFVDLGGGSHQSYVEDCQVCCRPWQVRVDVDDEGRVALDLEALDE